MVTQWLKHFSPLNKMYIQRKLLMSCLVSDASVWNIYYHTKVPKDFGEAHLVFVLVKNVHLFGK